MAESSAPTPSATPSASTPAVPPQAKTGEVSKNPVVPAPVSKAPVEEMFDVVVDGKAEKKTRKEMVEAYQLRQLSDKKRAEADKTLQEYNKLFEHLKKDPIKFMQATGMDFDKIATGYLSKKAEESMMDPKDRELRDAKAKAAEYEKWVNEQKAAQENTKKQQAIEGERSKIHSEIVTAIQEAKDLGMPVDEELVIAIAQKMILQDKKQKPLNAKEALPEAVKSTQKFIAGMASKMDGAALINWLGQDVAMKIRKHDLSELKKKRGAAGVQPGSAVKAPTNPQAPEKKYKTWSDFKRDTLDKIV